MTEYDKFNSIIRESHRLPSDMHFAVSYTDPRNRDLLPITNNDNMLRAFDTAMPFLRIIVYRERRKLIFCVPRPYHSVPRPYHSVPHPM